jgi:hypothetical protein
MYVPPVLLGRGVYFYFKICATWHAFLFWAMSNNWQNHFQLKSELARYKMICLAETIILFLYVTDKL